MSSASIWRKQIVDYAWACLSDPSFTYHLSFKTSFGGSKGRLQKAVSNVVWKIFALNCFVFVGAAPISYVQAAILNLPHPYLKVQWWSAASLQTSASDSRDTQIRTQIVRTSVCETREWWAKYSCAILYKCEHLQSLASTCAYFLASTRNLSHHYSRVLARTRSTTRRYSQSFVI